VIYIEIHGAAYSIVNPVFESLSDEKFELWDDCFSFPDLLVRVQRSISARLRYDGSDGTSEMLMAERDFAELLQHEVDHLDGILAIDRAIDRHSWCWRSEYPVRADAESAP
jgi:peptide deformylase